MIIMEGQGVSRHVGGEPSVSLCFVLFFAMAANGVDTMRFPCGALNVKVVRNSKQARTNDRSNHGDTPSRTITHTTTLFVPLSVCRYM